MNGVVRPFRALIVDDCPDSTDTLCAPLLASGVDTQTADCGKIALGKFGEFQPDMVLIELGMLNLVGASLCERIRELPTGKDAMLVAVTSFGNDEQHQRCTLAGFNHYLVKPVDQGCLQLLLNTHAEANGMRLAG